MARAVESNAVDVVGLARSICVDPCIPRKALTGQDFPNPLRKRSSGIGKLDAIGMVELTWYGEQLARMGRGKPPDPEMSVWKAVVQTVLSKGVKAFRQRRA